MKKFTLLIAMLVCAISFGQNISDPSAGAVPASAANLHVQAQQLPNIVAPNLRVATPSTTIGQTSLSGTTTGAPVLNGPAGTATKASHGTTASSLVPVTVTHSNTQTINPGDEIACASATSFRDNSVFRAFDLAGDFGIPGDFEVTAAEIAIGAGVLTPAGFPMTVNIWSSTGAAFPAGTLTLLASETVTITVADSETLVSVPISALVPAGEEMILEAMIVDDGTDTNFMRFGANLDGQTGPSWILADVCGATTISDLAIAFGLNNSFVMNVVGDDEPGGTGGGGDPIMYGIENAAGTYGSMDPADPSVFTVIGPNSGTADFEAAGAVNAAGDEAYALVNTGELFSVDLLSGVYTSLGTLNAAGANSWTGMEFDPVSGTLYAINLGADTELYTVDTGAVTATLVGGMGSSALGVSFAIDGAGVGYVFDVVDDNIHTVDLATGVGTVLGASGFDGNFGQSMAYDPTSDQVYLGAFNFTLFDSELRILDTATGNTTLVGQMEPAALTQYGWIGFPDMSAPPVCTTTTYDATGLPIDIDGAGTSTADCAGAPNLVPITVAEVGTIGGDAIFESLTINITHTFTADLDIFLVAPTGEEIELTTDNGGGGDNFTDTVFEDGGADITAGTAPFTGTFQPEGGTFAAAFAGVEIQGTWNLRLCDDAGGDTGTIDSVSMNICVPEQPLTNNVCEGATPVACDDVVVGDTSDNTDDGGNNAAPDEWYSFTGTGAAQFVTVSLCDGGTTYDSRLTVFDSCGGTIIATNDDSCGLQSELNFVSDGTSTYYIAIEGFGAGDVGAFSMAITCDDVAANDLCSNAEAINCGDTVAGSTVFATDDIGVAPDCDTPTTAPGVWYVYTDTTGLVTDITLTTCDDADYDTKISVYTGDCGAPPLTCVAGNDDDADCTGFTSTVEFQSDGASTYYILVHGFNTATGNFNLTMDCVPVPPDNDMIVNAIDLDEVGCPFTDVDVAMPAATTEGGNPTDCNIDGANGVWYKFTPLGDGFITGTVATPAGFTSVTFYSSADENATEGDLTRVDWFENQCLPSDFGRIPFVAGQSYYCFVVNSGGRTDIVFSECETLNTADNTIEGFSFYPNPANETINLASVELIESVAVYNLLGQKVMSQDVNTTTTQIDVTSLSQGAYLMQVSVNGQVGTYKIIKE